VGAAAAAMLIFCAIPSKAVDPHRMSSQYARDHWTIENEFPGGAIAAFAQTPDGYLWIGTEKGLFRFDGLSFRVFQQASPESLLIGPVQTLMADNTGNLWILLANTKLLRFHDGKFELGRGKAEVGVTAIGKRANGTPLFASLAYGALTYQDGSFLTISPSSDLSSTATAPSSDDLSTRLSWATSVAAHNLAQPDSAVTSMVETSDGRVWLGTRDKGLFYLDHGQISSLRMPAVSRNVRALVPLENGDLWIGTERGIFRWNGKEISQIGIAPALRQAEIRALIRDRDANVWVGTTDGLVRINNDGVSIDDVGSDHAKPVTALFEDREGNLWIGRSHGIERLRETAFVTYPLRKPQEESGGPVFVDATGRAWFASFKGGLQWLRQGQAGTVLSDGLSHDVVYSITGDKDELWVGRQRGGLTRLRYGAGRIKARTYTVSDGLAENSVYAVHRSRDGAIWAATLNAGISQFVDGHFKTYSTANGLPSNTITSIDDSSDGTMWFGTPNGLVTYSRNKWSVFTSRDGLPSDNITCLLRDSTDNLWIGTVSGLALLKSGSIRNPESMPSALREEILGIAADNIGNLWIATSNHILSVKRARLLSSSLTESDIREYGLDDGLVGNQGVKRFRSVFADGQGKIWFSTDRGLAAVDPIRADRESAPVIVQIEGISADGNALDLEPPIRVPPDTNRLTFKFSGLSLSDPKRIQFKYKLEGFDGDWSEPVSNRAATYTHVDWGPYAFRVIASNSAGIWNEQAVNLPFTIAPRWYQTRVFRILLAASLLLGIWALHRWRIHQLTAQEQRMRDVVETIPAMTFTTSADGSSIFVNKGWTEYTGLSIAETSGAGWRHAIHPEDLARHSEKWRTSIATGQLFEDEARFRRAADGEYRWFLVRGVPLRERHGKIVRWYGTLTDIEDRKGAEEALQDISRDLQESNTKLEEAQRITHVGYWERDLATDRITWSDETYRIYGLRPQEDPIDLAVLRQKIHPEDWKFVSHALDEALGGGARYNIAYRVLRPTGEVRSVHSTGDVKRDASGRPYKMFGTVQDITDRKRAEEALQLVSSDLQDSKAKLEEAQRIAHVGYWEWDLTSKHVTWSDETYRIYGLPPQEYPIDITVIRKMIHPEDLEFVFRVAEEAIRGGLRTDVEHRIIRPTGELRTVHSQGDLMRDASGRPYKMFGTVQDVTDRKRAEETLALMSRDLQESKTMLEEAQRIAHVGHWVFDVGNDELTWSDELYRIYGLRPQERPMNVKALQELIHPEDWESALRATQEVRAGGRPDLEFRIVRPSGEVRIVQTQGDVTRDVPGQPRLRFGTVQDITDRKRAEEDLRRSQFYLTEGQRLAQMGSWAFNPAGFFDYWSEELFRIYGLDPQKGAPTLEQYLATVHPADRDFMANTIKRMHAEHSGCDVKKRIICPGGELRYIRCVGIPVVEGEALKGFLGTAIDITEQELLTQELERRQAYLAEAQKLTHTGSWAWNVATDELFWSEEIFRIYEVDPLKAKPAWPLILERVHPDDRALLLQRKKMESTLTKWAESEADFRIVVQDGRIKHLHSIAHPVTDASGQIIEVIGTVMDVTERKQVEDSLRRSERHLAEAQRLTHTASWAWRLPDPNAVEVSEEFYRIFGFDPAERVPTWEEYLERVHPEDRFNWKSIAEGAILEKADYDHEFRILLPNGIVKWIHTVGHPVLSNTRDLEGFVGSSTDITERKLAEQEREKLRQLEADLAHIDRVSTLGEMAASLAHEIKQPIAAAITSANSCIEWLSHEPPNLDRARAAAARIDKYGNRAAEIIDRIRSFYKKSPPQREVVDVNGIIQEMLTLLTGEATRYSVAMDTELAPELPKITADRVQLQQVFMNLMLNAIEAMKDRGGELTVKSELQHGQLQFSVRDTGSGLPAGSVDQIFSAFFTTKPQGSGMGLAISRSIVESHGGQLWASANSGGGATFHFTLPIQVTESSPLVA
jgi:PAS domain S-box-containing protein